MDYKEGPSSTFTHDYMGTRRVDDLIEATKDHPVRMMNPKMLEWVFKYNPPEPERTRIADPEIPVIIARFKGEYSILDGAHRTAKAIEMGMKKIPVKLISNKELRDIPKVDDNNKYAESNDGLFWKLAFARFDSKLEENGVDPKMIKQALWLGEKARNVSGNTFSDTLRNMRDMIWHGSEATSKTRIPGMFSSKKEREAWQNLQTSKKTIKEVSRKAMDAAKAEGLTGAAAFNRAHEAISAQRGVKAPGLLKRVGTSAARGMNRLFAGMSAADLYGAATRKRGKGEGFLESIGSRAGTAAGAASLYVPGAAGKALTGLTFGEIAGLPGLKSIGSTIGRAGDQAISKVRGLAAKSRGMFGGGQSFEQKKQMAMLKRPKAKLNESNRFNMKAEYQ
jgi:hypothetical protein